jgi:multidrug efflux pump subunit AcrA (membrane-fusion protein)
MKPILALGVFLLFTGPLLAQAKNVELRAKVSGVIESIHVKEGDKIKKGALLLQFDSRELKAMLAQAEAEVARSTAILAESQARLERAKRLRQLIELTQAELDVIVGEHANAAALLQAHRARIDLLAATLNDTRILAPADGLIQRLNVKVGESVKANDTILLVIRDGADQQPKDDVRELQKERLKVLMKLADLATEQFKDGNRDYKSVLRARRAVCEAELELCETAAQRIDVLRKDVELVKDMSKLIASIHKSGQIPHDAVLEAEVQVLEVRIRLAREEAKAKATK